MSSQISDQVFPFLKLPLELRCMVYDWTTPPLWISYTIRGETCSRRIQWQGSAKRLAEAYAKTRACVSRQAGDGDGEHGQPPTTSLADYDEWYESTERRKARLSSKFHMRNVIDLFSEEDKHDILLIFSQPLVKALDHSPRPEGTFRKVGPGRPPPERTTTLLHVRGDIKSPPSPQKSHRRLRASLLARLFGLRFLHGEQADSSRVFAPSLPRSYNLFRSRLLLSLRSEPSVLDERRDDRPHSGMHHHVLLKNSSLKDRSGSALCFAQKDECCPQTADRTLGRSQHGT